MRLRMAVVLALAILLAPPAGAADRQAGDARLEREAATLPRELWEPAPEPVSAAGPGLPEEAAHVAPLLAVLLLLGALGAGYALSVLRPVRPSAATDPDLPPAAGDERRPSRPPGDAETEGRRAEGRFKTRYRETVARRRD